MSSRAQGRIIVVTAPSGAGKTSIARMLLKALPEIRFSVSATTRTARAHELNGVDYHFLSVADFEKAVGAGDLIEHVEVYPGLFYGTLKSSVDTATNDRPILLDIDVEGARRVKDLFGDAALCLFIKPPSLDSLAKRLRSRGSETEEQVAMRLARAEAELSVAETFDQVIVNDDLSVAADETIRVVRGFLGREIESPRS